jgi:hypothetical protein
MNSKATIPTRWTGFGFALVSLRRMIAAIRVAAMVLAVSAGAAACGGSDKVTCGSGTQLRNGVCILSPGSDASIAPPDAAAQSMDAAQAADTDAPVDAAVDADSATAQPDLCPEAADASYAFLEDCDDHCTQSPQMMDRCPDLTCSTVVREIAGGFSPSLDTDLFRTPNAPGTDPQCLTACSQGYVYGFGFRVGLGFSIIVRVGDPWVIIAHSLQPYCTDSNSLVLSHCARIDLSPTHAEYVFVMTKDPNAPARNITIQVVTGNEACS